MNAHTRIKHYLIVWRITHQSTSSTGLSSTKTNIADVNFVLSKFEVNVNHGDPQGLKLYLQAKKDIEKIRQD